MTRQEANRILEYGKRNGCHYKRGYCCYQEDGISKFDMVEIGSNSGIYGWNWTLYFNPKTSHTIFRATETRRQSQHFNLHIVKR